MVEDRTTDGRRIAELLASELDGREDGALGAVAIVNADRDVEPSVEGGRAYDIVVAGDEDPFARAFVQPDRLRLEFDRGQETAAETAEDVGLRVRPKATTPPRTLVFVEDGAQVKRATDVVQAVVRADRGG
jgi:hypothetical protein